MHILVDGGTWTNRRGYGRFTREILSAAAPIAGAHAFTLLLDASVPAETVPPGIHVARVQLDELPTEGASADGRRSTRDLWRMSRALGAVQADCVFFPSVYTYVPVLTRAPVVVCLHDVIAERLPDQVFPTRRSRLFWTMKTTAAVWQAARIVTVSEHARTGIAKHFGINAAAIRVVSEAPASVFSPLADPAPGREVLSTLGLPANACFLLYVGGVAPHKNLMALVDVVRELRSQMPSRDLRLLIAGDHTGDVFHSGYAALRAHLDRHQTTEVCFTGPVPDRALAGLMRLAQALVLPSLDEGFGLPGIEAAACGAAVVATRHSALPEVLGDAAVYFDPYEPGGLRRAIEPVLQDAALRAALGARASERAGGVSWTAAARSLLAAFDELAS